MRLPDHYPLRFSFHMTIFHVNIYHICYLFLIKQIHSFQIRFPLIYTLWVQVVLYPTPYDMIDR